VCAQKQNVIPDLEDVWKAAMVQLTEAQALRDQHTKMQELKWELAWAYIHEKESELGSKMEEIEVAERSGPTLQEKIRQAEEKHHRANVRIAEIETEVQGLGNVDDLEREKANLSVQIREGRQELAETQVGNLFSLCMQLLWVIL
jgi:chromosome segregation ATPase